MCLCGSKGGKLKSANFMNFSFSSQCNSLNYPRVTL